MSATLATKMRTTAPKEALAASHALSEETLESTKRSGSGISQLIDDLSSMLLGAINEIEQLNFRTRLVSLNARIEAARAGGTVGAAFGVVAQEVQGLSTATGEITKRLANQSRTTMNQIVDELSTNVRGTRLSDLALTNIELIDRNLYERTCDVRWWATDASIVSALQNSSEASVNHACQRMGVILDAYTVYFDLVLCDARGRVVANGRPNLYSSIGMSQSDAEWFREAFATTSGNEFGFQSAHNSPLVAGKSVLTYSCTVRENGDANGRVLGVLGVLFNWDGLAQTILTNIPITPEEQARTRAFITDRNGVILSDSRYQLHGKVLEIPNRERFFMEKKGFTMAEFDGKPACIAHAIAPGFETYTTGWHSVIVQSNEEPAANR